MARHTTDRFEVHEFDPYSGWDLVNDKRMTRREAWNYVKVCTIRQIPCAVHQVVGDTKGIVWQSKEETIYDCEHRAWLDRCPR